MKVSDQVTVLNILEFITSFVILYNLCETVQVSKTGNFVHFWNVNPHSRPEVILVMLVPIYQTTHCCPRSL